MNRRCLIVLFLISALAGVARAATPPKASAPRSIAAPRPTSTPSATRSANRTLEDIHIEGEIPVPQVLFITARDQRRFMEFQHGRYLRTSRQLGEATPLPSRVVLNRVVPTQAKETLR